ncbi:MAG TPA: ubiquinone biosynthesis regulatory protein kinase UbiB [Gammaproteobacteria bacterium]|nr:ubiquinone biosynthesis regulatory protein kinase UbiB [Gammaproteobacteria bacterium]
MKPVRQFLRLVTINIILLRHGLDEFIFAIHFFRPLEFAYKLAPWNWFRRQTDSRAVRLRRALEDLGPIFVKFGQMLSTRRDLLPAEYAVELARLQDRVPPFPSEQAVAIIEKAIGQPVNEAFAEFEREPMASASIAQVHAARLKNGREVVVKVVRPEIIRVIHRDLELMYILAQLAAKYWRDGKRLRPVEVVREYEKTILDELDMMREAANASQLRRNFENSEFLYVPEVIWDLTSTNVIVMERIRGIPVNDAEALEKCHVDFKALAERGVEIFFTQVFRHNFFHADMHPGNIFVDPTHPAAPRYIAVDFGIIGSLTPSDQRYLAENFYAFFRRDYRRVAELHVESGWVPADTRVTDFESAIRTVCEPIFERPLREISFGLFLLRLFQTARRFNMEVQPQLVLLQKTLLNIEGLGRDLYPDLDLWKTAKPFIENWMHEQVGVKALARGIRTNLPKFLEKLPATPLLIHEMVQKAANDNLTINYQARQLERLEQTLRAGQRRNGLWLLAAALGVSAVLLIDRLHGGEWLGLPWISWGLFGGALWAVVASFRR